MAIAPPILETGDTIGIVTLGSPLARSVMDSRIQVLYDLGFNVVLGDCVYCANGFLAGSDKQRANDLMQMFEDEAVDMILPTRGGVGVAGILPYLDFGVINQHPKVISGYSDITVLLNALFQYADLITLQSLLLIDFTMGTPAYNYEQFFEATSTLIAPRQIENPPGIRQVSRVRGDVTGELVGGNLTSFVGMLGTPYDIDTTDRIILLEETNEPINTVYRYLKQLELAGKFDDCIGIVLGECTGCPDAYGVSYNELINYFFVPMQKPLMTNVTTAHGTYKAAIPIGAIVKLNTNQNTLTVLEPSVQPKSNDLT